MAEAAARKFLIIRLGSLGDLVHTIPAVAALRLAFPQAKIDWVVEQRWSALIEMVTCVDEVIPLRRTLSGQLDCVRQLRRAHYQCAIDFQGLYKSALLAWFSGAPRRIGRTRQAAREPGAAWFYTDRVSPQGRHVAEMSLSLTVGAGAQPPAQSDDIQFPLRVPPAAGQHLAEKLSKDGIADYIVVSPGGGWKSKCWPAVRYGALCDELWQRRGLRAVVNAGPGEEQLAQEVVAAAGAAKPLVLSPSLVELAALLAQAQLVIAADTGPLHLAAALGTRVVALFGPTDEARNGPLPGGRVVRRPPTSASTDAEAPNTQRGDYTRGNDYSQEMLGLSVEQVLAAVEEEMSVRA